MLTKPYFRTCQRLRLLSGSGRNYLALWTLQSPEAFKTPEYLVQWGFSEWAPYIADWSRDLFDAGAAPSAALAVAAQGCLHAVSFDGMSEDEADAARAELAKSQPRMMWLPVAGLDRHTPLIGLSRCPRRPVHRMRPKRTAYRTRYIGRSLRFTRRHHKRRRDFGGMPLQRAAWRRSRALCIA